MNRARLALVGDRKEARLSNFASLFLAFVCSCVFLSVTLIELADDVFLRLKGEISMTTRGVEVQWINLSKMYPSHIFHSSMTCWSGPEPTLSIK